jgi:hypothetical protein
MIEASDVRIVVTAAREVTHAAANVASVCGAKNKDEKDPTLLASMEAARAAFRLDDIYRRHNGSRESLQASIECLQNAESAIRAAREALDVRVARSSRVH